MITLSTGALVALLLFTAGAAGAAAAALTAYLCRPEPEPEPDIPPPPGLAAEFQPALPDEGQLLPVHDAHDWAEVIDFVGMHAEDGLEIRAVIGELAGQTILRCPVGCRLRIPDDIALAADPSQVRALEVYLGGFPR